MAADTAAWHGDIKLARVKKIFRLRDGRIFGGYGSGEIIRQCAQWLDSDGQKPAEQNDDEFGGIILSDKGMFWVNGKFDIWESTAPFSAGGAHNEFLYGAMAVGASAEVAVCMAIKYCANAGGELQVERLEPAPSL